MTSICRAKCPHMGKHLSIRSSWRSDRSNLSEKSLGRILKLHSPIEGRRFRRAPRHPEIKSGAEQGRLDLNNPLNTSLILAFHRQKNFGTKKLKNIIMRVLPTILAFASAVLVFGQTTTSSGSLSLPSGVPTCAVIPLLGNEKSNE